MPNQTLAQFIAQMHLGDKPPIRATGRHKEAVAQVYLGYGVGAVYIGRKANKKKGKKSRVRLSNAYFTTDNQKLAIQEPFVRTALIGRFLVVSKVHGGGLEGQAKATRLGISRALLKYDSGLRGPLRGGDPDGTAPGQSGPTGGKPSLLTRDAREKERKKPGQPGARKKFQFSKR